MSEPVELLFFDTFSHESSEELNLDLVQFPKPVYVTEVRIIPLGARVQADFPGGVRLGATNPSQFSIEFFVNDLGKPGASTFESLGGFEYNQNGCIHLECTNNEVNVRQIPTDGLVLRGWYTTITLAVYGTLTKNITEQIVPAATNAPSINQQPALVADVQQIVSANTIESNWQQDVPMQQVPMEYGPNSQVNYTNNYDESYPQDYHNMDYYHNDAPKDPRYHHTTEPPSDWDGKSRPPPPPSRESTSRSRAGDLDRDPEHNRDSSSAGVRHFARSHSRDRNQRGGEYREVSRDREREWIDKERPREGEYREREREKDWDRSYKHQDGYKRTRDAAYGRGISQERDPTRKRPRTPPIASPKRPHTPKLEKDLSPGDVESISEDEIAAGANEIKPEIKTEPIATIKPETKPQLNPEQKKSEPETIEDAPNQIDLEQFEPILSDEDICDESENFQDIDYDFAAYSNNDDVIKLFNPITTELQKYRSNSYINIRQLLATVDENQLITLINNYFSKYDDKLNQLISLLKPHANKYGNSDFKNLSPEVKEEFVHACEQLPIILNNNQQYFNFITLFTLIDQINDKKLDQFYSELRFVQKILLDFVNISLDFDLAFSQNQPGYKIRHIKCGVRLIEACCCNHDLIDLIIDQNIHFKLLDLFDREYMALSIKLLILRSLDASLSSEKSIKRFISHKKDSKNGYQMLINIMKNASSVRIKFAVNSLMTKLNIYEVLEKLKTTVIVLCNNPEIIDLTFIIQSLTQILKLHQNGPFEISQPKRFLPVSAQFEINRSEEKNALYNFYSIHRLLELLLLLLTHPKSNQCTTIVTTIYELITELLNSYDGLKFLSENLESVTLLMKCFMQPEDLEAQYILSEAVYIKSQSLALKIAYKMQILYHIECLLDIGRKNHFDCDVNEVLDQLHAFYCLIYVNIGKISCSEVLSLGNNIECLLQFLNLIGKDEKKDYSKLKKSPGIGYVIDLLTLTVVHSSYVPFLEKYGKLVLEIAQQHDKFETTTAAKLNEIISYLKPLVFAYDDIKPLCETVKESLDTVTNFPGQLITALRILKHLGISKYSHENSVLLENSSYNLIELKYKYVILQLYSLDGIGNLVTILTKICEHYEQPSLHIPAFLSPQGALIINTILPCVQLLRQMLMNIIHCRNTEFKDLTLIPILLQTFNLAHTFPQSSIVWTKAREICREIINILLVYSQPISDEVSENDSLNKTLWTLMSGEVIKYITLAPYTFIPGLLIFSELLPLPLPFQTSVPLTDDEIKRAINLRKLWSAHLHSHSTSVQELINRLCTSVHQPLLHLLRRVCIQLSDLAANTAIMIARGVLDSVNVALTSKTTEKTCTCNGHTARLLHFLACLTTHGAIKCAVLQLFGNNNTNSLKTDEKYPSLVTSFCQILKQQSDSSSAHVQAQECIISIIQNLFDTEITLIQSADISSETYLANALPPKEILVSFLTTLLEHFTMDNPFTTLLPTVRTFILLSEHDYGFYHLCACFEKKPYSFLSILRKCVGCFSKENADLLQTLSTILDFLRVCCDDMEIEGSLMFAPRSIKLSAKELISIVGWSCEEYSEDTSQHPLCVLDNLVKKNFSNEEPLDNVLDNLSNLIRLLNTTSCSNSETESTGNSSDNIIGKTFSTMSEPILPIPDTLLGQFACRPVYTCLDVSEEQLTTGYWLSAPSDDGSGEIDQVTCDLMEISRQNLTVDHNISREVEKLIRVYPSQETNRQISEQLKPKRVVVNENQRNNDKMKKPYVTPMRGRGFPRTAPQRGDLFRSRPPNTSRPPSLHVDDFVALETCGAQPTGPTGYNKLSRDLLNTRAVRSVRGGGRTFISPDRGVHFRPL